MLVRVVQRLQDTLAKGAGVQCFGDNQIDATTVAAAAAAGQIVGSQRR